MANEALMEHPAAVDALERELVQGLSEALELTGDSGRPARSAVRRRGFDRAIEHIRHADLGVLDLPTLALAAGISRRAARHRPPPVRRCWRWRSRRWNGSARRASSSSPPPLR